MADQSIGAQVFAPVFALLLQPAGHVTITEPATDDLLAIAPVNESSGQIEFVYEDPGADSLEFDEPIRLYPCNLCHVKCRRPYDLERHHKTKHHQSEHWFCPVDTCRLSCNIAGIGPYSNGYFWLVYRQRKPLTFKLLLADEENGYHKLQLHGFPRRDKLVKHLRRHHQEEFLSLRPALCGKEPLHTKPLICEAQSFWAYRHQVWYESPLIRLEVDGKWSEYAGYHLKKVAEVGFQRWTKRDKESYDRLRKLPDYHTVLPWEAYDLLLELDARNTQESLPQQSRGFSVSASTTVMQGHSDEIEMDACSSQLEYQSEPSFTATDTTSISSGLEVLQPCPANTHIRPLLDSAVEESFYACDWEAFFNTDLNSGIDMNDLASNQADSSALDNIDPNSGFGSNNLVLDNGAVADFDFDFNDPNSLPEWYFSGQENAGAEVLSLAPSENVPMHE